MMQKEIPLFQVDAFTSRLFAGNPAAVVLMEQEADPVWMLNVAREMNLSETAFVYPKGEEFGLRWFTPSTEVELCGHATLASAHVLYETGRVEIDIPITFQTKSGLLGASLNNGKVELDFPASPVTTTTLNPAIIKATGGHPNFTGSSGDKWLMEFGSERDVRELVPDFDALRRFPGRGLVVTSRSDQPGVDFVSRYFAPWIGVNEDPVTGSAHTILAPYWAKLLGKVVMRARQVSSRGGELDVVLAGDRVRIGGNAVTVFKGTLYLQDVK